MNSRHYSIEDAIAPQGVAVVRGGLLGWVQRTFDGMAKLFSRHGHLEAHAAAEANQVVALRQEMRRWRGNLKKFRLLEREMYSRARSKTAMARCISQLEARISEMTRLCGRSESLQSSALLNGAALEEAKRIHAEANTHLSVLKFELRMLRASYDLTGEMADETIAVFAGGPPQQPSTT